MKQFVKQIKPMRLILQILEESFQVEFIAYWCSKSSRWWIVNQLFELMFDEDLVEVVNLIRSETGFKITLSHLGEKGFEELKNKKIIHNQKVFTISSNS